MSEYICKKGHLMKSGEYYCSICGERIGYEDGMSRNEMRKLEGIEDIEKDKGGEDND